MPHGHPIIPVKFKLIQYGRCFGKKAYCKNYQYQFGFSKLYFWLCSTSDIQRCIDYLEAESESSETGPSYLSDTVTTASEEKERDGSSRASSCQVKTRPSTNGAVTKTSYPSRGNSTCPTCVEEFPLGEIEARADLCVDY